MGGRFLFVNLELKKILFVDNRKEYLEYLASIEPIEPDVSPLFIYFLLFISFICDVIFNGVRLFFLILLIIKIL